MTEKLGVLLVDVPEPRLFKYAYIIEVPLGSIYVYTPTESDDWEDVVNEAYRCPQKDAKEYPQFRWVALEEL